VRQTAQAILEENGLRGDHRERRAEAVDVFRLRRRA